MKGSGGGGGVPSDLPQMPMWGMQSTDSPSCHTLGSASASTSRPCWLWAASSGWLGTAGILGLSHFRSVMDTNSEFLPWASQQPGEKKKKNFVRIALQSGTILFNPPASSLSFHLSHLYCDLNECSSQLLLLTAFPYSLSLTSISPNKSAF